MIAKEKSQGKKKEREIERSRLALTSSRGSELQRRRNLLACLHLEPQNRWETKTQTEHFLRREEHVLKKTQTKPYTSQSSY